VAGCAVLNQNRVPGGAAGCKAVCEKWGMELSGMVQVGQYSDACVCGVKKEAAGSLGAGAAIAAIAAVEQQERDEQTSLQGGAATPLQPGLIPPVVIDGPGSSAPVPTAP
jgi:hypothetical protein